MQFTRVVLAALAALGMALVPAVPASAHGVAIPPPHRLLIPSAGWHGRPIKNPHQHKTIRTSAAATPLRGWSAGPVSFGAGYQRPGGSDRVREVQRRLTPARVSHGPLDGLFGPLTRRVGRLVPGQARVARRRPRDARHRPGISAPAAGAARPAPGVRSRRWSPTRPEPESAERETGPPVTAQQDTGSSERASTPAAPGPLWPHSHCSCCCWPSQLSRPSAGGASPRRPGRSRGAARTCARLRPDPGRGARRRAVPVSRSGDRDGVRGARAGRRRDGRGCRGQPPHLAAARPRDRGATAGRRRSRLPDGHQDRGRERSRPETPRRGHRGGDRDRALAARVARREPRTNGSSPMPDRNDRDIPRCTMPPDPEQARRRFAAARADDHAVRELYLLELAVRAPGRRLGAPARDLRPRGVLRRRGDHEGARAGRLDLRESDVKGPGADGPAARDRTGRPRPAAGRRPSWRRWCAIRPAACACRMTYAVARASASLSRSTSSGVMWRCGAIRSDAPRTAA